MKHIKRPFVLAGLTRNPQRSGDTGVRRYDGALAAKSRRDSSLQTTLLQVVFFSILLILPFSAIAQQRASIFYVYPCGVQRGTTAEITVGGQNFRDVTGVIVSGEGIKAELIQDNAAARTMRPNRRNIGDEDNLQFAERVRIKMTVDPQASLGMRDLRLESSAGISNRLFFEVGQYLDFVESGKTTKDQPNIVPSLPATLNGQIMAAERDYFRFQAKKGETIVLRAQARVFIPYIADAVPGWFQSVMTLYNPNGREVAYCDDYMFHVDPVIIYTVPENGEYCVEIKDALYRGREDFTYRIDVGQIPFITSISPMGGKKGSTVDVELNGANLKSNTMTVKALKNDHHFMELSQNSPDNKYISNNVRFELSDLKETTEKEPNDNILNAQNIEPGIVVNGVISKPGDDDWYKIDAVAGTTIVFEVMARKLGSPLDAKLTLFNSRGGKMTEVDDLEDKSEGILTHHADPVIVYRFPQTGTFFVRLTDTQQKGGNDYSYRFKIYRPEPDFSLNIDPASLYIPSGGTAIVNVSAIRKQSFRGNIEVNIKGLPKGSKVSHNIIPGNSSRITMTITAPARAKVGKLNLEVTGKAISGGTSVTQIASPAESAMQAFYFTHLVPAEEFMAEIAPKQPFSLSIDNSSNPLKIVPGKPAPLKVKIDRDENFKDTITVMLRTGGGNILTTTAVKAGPGQKEVVLQIETRTGTNNADLDPRRAMQRFRNMQLQIIVQGVTRSTTSRIAGQSRGAFV